MKKLFTIFCLAIIGLLTTNSLRAEVGDTFADGQFQFTVLTENPNTVSLTGITVASEDIVGEVIIPSSVNNEGNDYSVTTIGGGPEIGLPTPFERCINMTEVKIPETVTYIGENAFFRCTGLKQVILPNSLTYIGRSAFASNDFTQLTIPKNVITIEPYAFSNCPIEELTINSNAKIIGVEMIADQYFPDFNIPFNNLKKVMFGDYVTNIPSFRGANSLSEVILPTTLKDLPNQVFYGCESLKNIAFPAVLETIGSSAFSGCTALTSVDLPASLNTIGSSAFSGCSALTSVELPASLNTIDSYAFYGCAIASLEIPTSVTSIGNSAFANNNLTIITLPKTLQSVGSGAFYGCPIETLYVNTNADINGIFSYGELTKAVFSDDATTIPSFSGASKLSDITLPSPMTNIPDNAFTNCTSLKTINLPSGLQSIGANAFEGCSRISSIEIPSNVTSIGNNAFSQTHIAVINLPEDLTSLGNNAFANTPLASIALPNGLVSISEGTFSNCSSLQDVQFPINLKTIGNQAFYQCNSLYAINLPNGVEIIGSESFADCAITDLEIPSSLTTISEMAFANNKIATLTLPKNLNSIGQGAFSGNPIEKVFVYTNANVSGVFPYENLGEAIFGENATTVPNFSGASKLTYVTLPSLMENLPDNSFVDCISLQTVNFNENLKSIGSNTFNGCIALTEVELPSEINSIEEGAFSKSGLLTVRLPENVTSISKNLFANCPNLEKVYLSENVNIFGESAFQNCVSLRSLIIPEGVEIIPTNLMNGCTSLVEILIPNSVETISANAFQGCTALKNIDLGTGLYTIGDYAFADCPNITDIHSMALNPPIAESYTFPTKAYTNAMVTVREQSLATYNRENPWYRFQNYLTVSGAISLSHYNVDMAGNEVFQLGVYGSDSKIIWSSSNPSVAYANDCGLIVAMGITGATVITATVDGEEINCNVTVSSPYRDPQVYTRAVSEDEDLQPVDLIMEGVSGNPPMVNVRLVPVGSKTIIDWTSSDPALASVENGLVTVYGSGDVDFGVETENGLEEVMEIDLKDVGTSGIEEIFQSTEVMMPMSVFDLTGRIIYFNATLEQIKNLDKGLYIIKGKKVLVK